MIEAFKPWVLKKIERVKPVERVSNQEVLIRAKQNAKKEGKLDQLFNSNRCYLVTLCYMQVHVHIPV